MDKSDEDLFNNIFQRRMEEHKEYLTNHALSKENLRKRYINFKKFRENYTEFLLEIHSDVFQRIDTRVCALLAMKTTYNRHGYHFEDCVYFNDNSINGPSICPCENTFRRLDRLKCLTELYEKIIHFDI